MLYTDALSGAFAWQWLECQRMTNQPIDWGFVEAHMRGFRSRAEASQLGSGLLLRFWLQGLLQCPRLMSGVWPESPCRNSIRVCVREGQ